MPKHKHADLIKAWADGAKIEGRFLGDVNWHPFEAPCWLDNYEYRIKPEPKPDVIIIQPHARLIQGGLVLTYSICPVSDAQQVKWTIDGETGRIKSVELLDR